MGSENLYLKIYLEIYLPQNYLLQNLSLPKSISPKSISLTLKIILSQNQYLLRLISLKVNLSEELLPNRSISKSNPKCMSQNLFQNLFQSLSISKYILKSI